MKLAIFAAVLALASATPLADPVIEYKLCEDFPSDVTISGLTYTPNPPSIKKPLVVTARGGLTKTVTQGAKLVVLATAGTFSFTQNMDMCEEGAKNGLNCPILPGVHDLVNTVEIPKITPPFVTIKIRAEAYNGDGSKLFCVETAAKFVP